MAKNLEHPATGAKLGTYFCKCCDRQGIADRSPDDTRQGWRLFHFFIIGAVVESERLYDRLNERCMYLTTSFPLGRPAESIEDGYRLLDMGANCIANIDMHWYSRACHERDHLAELLDAFNFAAFIAGVSYDDTDSD